MIISKTEKIAKSMYDCFPKRTNKDLIRLNGQVTGENIKLIKFLILPDLVIIEINIFIG